MYQTKQSLLLLLFLVLTLQACQKETYQQNEEILLSESLSLKEHQTKVQIWMNLIPLNGRFEASSVIDRTIRKDKLIITNIQFGENGNSIYFISDNDKFHVYGINSRALTKSTHYEGRVLVYDFQNLSKQALIYHNNQLAEIGIYIPPSTNFDAYAGIYKLNRKSASFRTQSRSGFLVGIRKFFCELFGGTWVYAPYSLDTPDQYCIGEGGSGTESQETTSIIAPGSGGALGNILPLINNPNYFDINSGIWQTYLPWLTAGGGNTGAGTIWSGSTMFIDSACPNPDLIRAAFFTLNTIYNQAPQNSLEGSVEEMLQLFEAYKNEKEVVLPIIPWLIKAGANGSADALMQALFIYLTEDDCPSFGAAFGHEKFSKTQVARSSAEGLLPWRTPGGRLGKSAFTAVGDVIVNLIDGKYGTNDYEELGMDFMLGFFSDLAGGAAGELASK